MKSVRTTFKLSKEACDAITWFTENYKITMKEVFYSLCEYEDFLESVAEEISKKDTITSKRTLRKTYVISRNSLNIFKELAEKYNISRDELVETAILLHKKLFQQTIEDEKKTNSEALGIISKFLKKTYDTDRELREILVDGDPILKRFDIIKFNSRKFELSNTSKP
jgi:hypothetical protein